MSIIGNILKTLRGHTIVVKSLAVLQDGNLASASFERTIKIGILLKAMKQRRLLGILIGSNL